MYTTFKEVIDFIRNQFDSDDFIPLHAPVFAGNEKKYVLETIDSTYVSSVGKFVDAFQKMICEYTGSKYAVATVNGTAALHIALLVSGVQRNDLVITQPLTFISTCNAISYLGASPLFADIDENTLSLSPRKLESFLAENSISLNGECYHKPSGRRIKACIPMHTFGLSAKIDELKNVCDVYNIPMIEDSAESLGTTFKEKHTGTFGLCGVYSFNGNKTITCGGGGMIVTNAEQLAKRAKHITTQAKVAHAWEFNHDEIGYNYRLPNINAALGCAQMELLEKLIDGKRKLANNYNQYFRSTPIKHIAEEKNTRSNYWLNAILMRDKNERDKFLEYTNNNKVMTRPCWTLMHKLPMFKDCFSDDLSCAEWIEQRLVNIPSSPVLC